MTGGLKTGGFDGIYLKDSDPYKVAEDPTYILATHQTPKLETYFRSFNRDECNIPILERIMVQWHNLATGYKHFYLWD